MATQADNFKYLSNLWEQRPRSKFCPSPALLPPEMRTYGLCGLLRETSPYRILGFLTACPQISSNDAPVAYAHYAAISGGDLYFTVQKPRR